MYYKGYFRFWKRKTKKSFDPIFKRKIKKDRNIRITYMIYRADIPKKVKNVSFCYCNDFQNMVFYGHR